MQGILIVDKPMDWTSFDVVAKLRGVLGTRKLGHSGTLDPMATGVLPVFCGGASKAVDLQLNHDKTYRATLRLGARTIAPALCWKLHPSPPERRNCWLCCRSLSARRCRCRPCTRQSRSTDSRCISWRVRA